MELIVLKRAKKELLKLPQETIEDIFSLVDDLMAGQFLSMPISRPLFSIVKGLHELRISGRAGEFRVFYVIRPSIAIYILHASSKKSQKMEQRTIDLIKTRMKSLIL